MNMQPDLLRPLAVVLACCSLAACFDPTIVGGGDGGAGGGAEVAPSQQASGPGGQGGATTATAFLGVDLHVAPATRLCGNQGCEPADDDSLYLVIDSQGSTCAEPLTDAGSGSSFEVLVQVPPSHQEVGVHAIDESFLVGLVSQHAPPSGPSTATATGGHSFGGTLEILALTDTEVTFTLTGFGPFAGVEGPDGIEYVAPRCGTTDLPEEGVAFPGNALRVDGAADAGLTIVVGSDLATCGEALAASCAGDTWQLAVSLPAEYVAPGTYALDDPRIESTHCAGIPKFLGGSITILTVDDDELVVRFDDVVDHAPELVQELRIARCP